MQELYKIKDGSVVKFIFGKNADDATNKYRAVFGQKDIVVTKVLTDQGYPIVRLCDLAPGTYFHRTTLKDGEFCEHSVVWCRGDYDRSTKKYCCYKYEDVNHSHEFRREERVTIEFTF